VQDLNGTLEEEEDLWDEATVDRELSVVPGVSSDDEDEIEGGKDRMPTSDLPAPEPS
ncbi:hypothetical protein FOMPIDRAFT_1053250, partial [Fomitopsis schrenkii]